LNDLLNDNNPVTILVEADYEIDGAYADYVTTDKPYSKNLFDEAVQLKNVKPDLKKGDINGEFIGLWKVNPEGAKVVLSKLEEINKAGKIKTARMADLLNAVSAEIPVAVKFVKGAWLDIDNIAALHKAGDL
jgi:phosphoenolpyruvate phosphomutase